MRYYALELAYENVLSDLDDRQDDLKDANERVEILETLLDRVRDILWVDQEFADLALDVQAALALINQEV